MSNSSIGSTKKRVPSSSRPRWKKYTFPLQCHNIRQPIPCHSLEANLPIPRLSSAYCKMQIVLMALVPSIGVVEGDLVRWCVVWWGKVFDYIRILHIQSKGRVRYLLVGRYVMKNKILQQNLWALHVYDYLSVIDLLRLQSFLFLPFFLHNVKCLAEMSLLINSS